MQKCDHWLVTGAGGQLGSVLLRELIHKEESVLGTASMGGPQPAIGKADRLELTNISALRDLVLSLRPRYIIHCAAVTSLDSAWRDPDRARRTNVGATTELTRLAKELGSRLVFLSTDLVFDGTAAPYRETDPPKPLSIYGKSKAEAEQVVLAAGGHLVIRPALMYGLPAVDRPTTFLHQLRALRKSEPLKLFADEFRAPLWLEDAARACIEAAKSDVSGILHIAGPERLSRLEMGRQMARAMGVSGESIVVTRQRDLQAPEPRPADVSLDCRLFTELFGRPPGRPMAQAMREVVKSLADIR